MTLSGCLAGILAAEGALDIDKPVTYYIPELNPAALDGVTVHDLLNMRSGLKYTEGFGPEWDGHMQSRGFLPKPTPEHPDCQYLWMRDCVTEKAHEPGSRFEYKEVDTELLEVYANSGNEVFKMLRPDDVIGISLQGLPAVGYSNKFWVVDLPSGRTIWGMGMRSQFLVISPEQEAVIVHFGANWHSPMDHKWATSTMTAVLQHLSQ
ncbi:hypothetical protein WJX72_011321 [[Myrmecia] bisecta]|uniref:Beta-lactamase-related domain-containing protein n=1 Tax=[Myrmecia] bisecta TaxID=41462 RepID=A0AAW1Q1W9_9CHLO